VPITDWEQAEVDAANESGRRAMVFVHGLWLLPTSWDGWRARFEETGWPTLAPGWPDDPRTVEEARAHPEVFAGKSVGQVADHLAEVIGALDQAPVIVGHSFGGLLTQKLTGMGLAYASVAIDPAQFRGVLPLPLSALRGAFPVLKNPANRKRAVTLTFDEFRYGFANAVPVDEAERLYEEHHVACSGIPLFQVATANLNPKTEASVDVTQPSRGPLLIISGEHDHLVPWSVANAQFKRWSKHNTGAPTEIVEMPERGHSLIIDREWLGVADTALEFLDRHGVRP
jgi:non-heme chloroperoxidase